MSCIDNDILTSALVLDDKTRGLLSYLSTRINKLPSGVDGDYQRGLLENEITKVVMESVLSGSSSQASKVGLLDKFSSIIGPSSRARVMLLKKLDNIDNSINGNLGRKFTELYDTGSKSWDDIFQGAKKSIEDRLIYEYLSSTIDINRVAKKLGIEIVEGNTTLNRNNITDALSKLDDADVEKVLSGDGLYKELKNGGYETSDAINTYIAYASIFGTSDKKMFLDALNKIKGEKGLTESEIIKTIKSSSDMKDLKNRFNIVVKNIASLPKEGKKKVQEAIEEQLDKVITGDVDIDSQILAQIMPKMFDPNTSNLLNEYIDAIREYADLSLEHKLKFLKKMVNTDLSKAQGEVYEGINEILDDSTIKSLLGETDYKKFDDDMSDVLDRIKKKYNTNVDETLKKLETEKKELTTQRSEIIADKAREMKKKEPDKEFIKDKEKEYNRVDGRLDTVKMEISQYRGLQNSTLKIDLIDEFKEVKRIWATIKQIEQIKLGRSNILQGGDSNGIILSSLTKGSNNKEELANFEMKKTAFFNPEALKGFQGIDKVITDYYSQAFGNNNIDLGSINIFDSIEDLVSAVKNGDINNIVLPSQDSLETVGYKKLQSELGDSIEGLGIRTPQSPTDQAGFFVKDGKLKFGSYDKAYIKEKNEQLAGLNIINIAEENTKSEIDLANEIMNIKYGTQDEDIKKIVEELGLGEQYSIKDIENRLSLISKVSSSVKEGYFDIDALRYDLLNNKQKLNELFDSKLKQLEEENGFTADKKILEELSDEDKAELYINASYWKKGENSVQGELDFLSKFKVTPKGKKIDNFTEVAHNALIEISKEYGLPLKPSYVREFKNISEGKGVTNTLIAQFAKKNNIPEEDVQGIFEKYYDEALANYKEPVSKSGVSGKGIFMHKPSSKPYVELPNISDIPLEAFKRGSLEQAKIAGVYKKKAISAINKYQKEFNDLLSKGIVSTEDADRLKYNLTRSLKEIDYQINDNFIDLSMGGDARTYITSIPVVRDPNNIAQFSEQIQNLKAKYGSYLDQYIENANKVNDVFDSGDIKSTEVIESYLRDEDFIPVKSGTKIVKIPKDTMINNLIDDLPEGFEELKKLKYGNLNMTNAEKQDFISALRQLKRESLSKQGIYEYIVREYDSALGRELSMLKNQPVTIGLENTYLPGRFIVNNTSEIITPEGVRSFTRDEDLLLKQSILKDISAKMVSGEKVTLDDIKGYVKDNISIAQSKHPELSNDIENIINLYTADFSVYAKLPKFDEGMFKELSSMIKKENLLSPQAREILNSMPFTDVNGNKVIISDVISTTTDSYPDILYKGKDKVSVNASDVGGQILTQEQKDNIKRGVSRTLDMVENSFFIEDSMRNDVVRNFRTNALQAMQRSPRLNKVAQAVMKTLETGKIASKELRHQKSLGGEIMSLIKRSFNIQSFDGAKIYNPEFIEGLSSNYKKYMNMSSKEFADVIGDNIDNFNKLSQEEKSAYKIATHYRAIRSYTKDITNSSDFNSAVESSYEGLFDNLVKDGKFTKNAEGRLQNLEVSMNNGNIFYGIKAFEDLDMLYKTKKNFFGADEFSDAGLENFNRLFNSDYSINDYRVMIAAMTGDMLRKEFRTGSKPLDWVLSNLRATGSVLASPIFRFLSAFPGTLISGLTSSIGYLKALETYGKMNIDIDMKGASQFMRNSGILTSQGGDLYNTKIRDILPGIEEKIDRINPIKGLYDELPRVFGDVSPTELLLQITDNGQNVQDALFSQSLKVNAFASALRTEGFTSVGDFKTFLDNPNVPIEYKRRVYDNVISRSYMSFDGMMSYVGSDLLKNFDDGGAMSRIAGFTNAIINPINFRGSLGLNALKNSANNLKKVIEYGSRYGFSDELVDIVSKDPVLKNWIYSWFRDAMFAVKMANMENSGGTNKDTELDMNKVMGLMNVLSQNLQILRTAGPMRVFMAGLEEENEPLAAVLSSYAQNLFRQYTAGSNLIDGLSYGIAGAKQGGIEGFEKAVLSWFDNNYQKLSTSGLRYAAGEVANMAVSRSKGIDTLFGGENEFIDAYYGKNLVNLGTRLQRVFDGVQTEGENDKWELVKALMSINKVWRTGDNIKGFIMGDKEALTSTADLNEFSTDAMSSEVFQNFNRTGYFDLPYLANDPINNPIRDDINKYTLSKMILREVPGSNEWAEQVEGFYKNGKLGKEFKDDKTGETKISEERDGFTQLMTLMDRDGVLTKLYQDQQTNPDKDDAKRRTSLAMINYINQLSDEDKGILPGVDGMVDKIGLTIAYDDYMKSQGQSFKKSNKIINAKGKSVNGSLTDNARREIDERFIRNNLPRVQQIYSDRSIAGQEFSNLGMDLTTYAYARMKGIVGPDDVYFNKDDTGEAYALKGQYKDVLNKMQYVQRGIKAGKTMQEMGDTVYGIFGIFPTRTQRGDKSIIDSEIAVKTALYLNNVAKDLGIPQEDAIRMSTANLAFIGDKGIPVSDVRKFAGDDIGDIYENHVYQTYKDAVQLAVRNVEGWGGKGGGSKIKKFASDLAKLKEYVSNNAGDVYKPIKMPQDRISAYSLKPETIKQRALSAPDLPVYNAKSKKLFASVKAKKSNIQVTPTKKKSLSAKQLKGLKKK